MKFQTIPLIYAGNEQFKHTIRFAIEFHEDIIPEALSVELLNTVVRGQIILQSDESADIDTINGMVRLNTYMQSLSLEEKKQTMYGIISGQ